MTALQLQATKRTKKANSVRTSGDIPAILYGHGIPSESLALPYVAFTKVWKQAGESTLVDVLIDTASPRKVLIHDVQHHPLTDDFLHVDLYEVRMTEKMKTKVTIRFAGEAPAVKQKGGLLVKNLSQISVECLPGDLVHEIVVDLSGLSEFGHSIYVNNLVAPKGITILDKPTEPVVTVMRPKTEEELQKELTEETPKDVKLEEVVGKVQKEKKGDEAESAEDAAKTGEKKPQAKEAKKETKKEAK